MNVKTNLKKYFTIKFFDLISFLFFGSILFVSFVAIRNEYLRWGIVITAFVGFAFFNKYLQKRYDRMEVPNMLASEQKKYNIVTFLFMAAMFTLIGFLIKDLVSIQLYIFLALIILIATERRKSIDFKKKFAVPLDSYGGKEEVKKEVIEQEVKETEYIKEEGQLEEGDDKNG